MQVRPAPGFTLNYRLQHNLRQSRMFGTVSFSFCTKRAGISGMQILPSPFGLLYHFQLLSGRSPSLYPPGLCKDSRTARFPICGLISSKPLCFVLLDDSNASGILSWVVAYSLILRPSTASQMFSHQAVDPQKTIFTLSSPCKPLSPCFSVCHLKSKRELFYFPPQGPIRF